jgi:NAD(P)-dependent dehydrogenase (short-subunit alcohol dehydrogenase family)
MSTLFDLSREVAVVIGGTGTLGGALAEGLARAGCAVAIGGRNRANGEARAHTIEKAGGRAAFFAMDASQRDSLQAGLFEISRKFSVPTVLVNCAGGNSAKTTCNDALAFADVRIEDWLDNYSLNFVGGILLPCQVFGPAMLEAGRGSIINLASVSAHLPLSRVAAYSSAKAAVLNLSQWLAREWGCRGVRVNTITPGFFPAEQNMRLLLNEDGTPTERGRQIMAHTPLRRYGRPDELIGAAVFLASPTASSFVNGADIVVDGGFLAQTI